eukprot:UC4_evm2s261
MTSKLLLRLDSAVKLIFLLIVIVLSSGICGEEAENIDATCLSDNEGKDEIKDCNPFLSCTECIAAGCGWCLGARKCVEDIAWVCAGDEDHVGKVGVHKTCPDAASEREARRERKEREAKQAAEEIAAKVAAAKEVAQEDSAAKATEYVLVLQEGSDQVFTADQLLARIGNLQKIEYGPADESLSHLRISIKTNLFLDFVNKNGKINGIDLQKVVRQSSNTQGSTDKSLNQQAMEDKETLEEKSHGPNSLIITFQEPNPSLAAHDDGKDDEQTMEEMERLRREFESEKSSGESKKRARKAKQIQELQRRAQMIDEEEINGATHPYETLEVDPDVSQQIIRKVYRRLTVAFHPDKNQENKDLAERVFREIVAAYNIVGNPDKRSAFDDFGNAEGQSFNSYWEYTQSGQTMDQDYYQNNPYITRLTPKNWERRLTGNSIWIIEFYAPWCGACRNFSPAFKEAATKMEGERVDYGAVNCEKHQEICGSRFNIRGYPTVLAVNRKHGTQQEFQGTRDAESLMTWAKRVQNEWLWLFHRANLLQAHVGTIEHDILPSEDLWIMIFTDGFECAPCKTAKTNAMRLSAGLMGL